ncbi:MAG: imidazolonepropionase [Elusimicrobia bacterium]|nr:imidazolonepropionase [Elusimicrobiota bacterium]
MAGPRGPRCGAAMKELGLIRDGAILVQDGKILAAGPAGKISSLPEAKEAESRDFGGRVVLPGFVDSHAHPVFGAARLEDFTLRVAGAGRREIAQNGGGILSSVSKIREMSESALVEQFQGRARKFLEYGTTTLEAKSGYGLDLHSELKILKAIAKVAQEGPLEIAPTFLGAHAFPKEYKNRREEYVELVVREMIPSVVKHGLAEFVDVFCEKGYFTSKESERILKEAMRQGLKAKIHAEQMSRSGGARVAAKLKAVSADHLDHISSRDRNVLKKSGTVPVLLPASNFFLGSKYPHARRMIQAGLPVALATDFNPGTCPCWSMQMVISISCTQMRMLPEEAIVAATINGAHALGRGDRLGSLEPGKQADFIVMDMKDYREIPYYFGANQCVAAVKKGRVVYEDFAV